MLQLAAEQSPQSLSVAAVCRVAGVTRDTFYRHAGSPVDLLASALGEEIAEVVGGTGTCPASPISGPASTPC